MSQTSGQQRICSITGEQFAVTDGELEMLQKLRALYPYDWFHVPLPTIHPLEELRRLFSYTNYMNLTREASAISGKPQISRYLPQLGTKICTADEFWSDAVDNSAFGRPYDFTRPFFEQWLELYRECYILPLNNFNSEGSDYVNGTIGAKDCYLCFNTMASRDCLYCLALLECNDLVACVGTNRSQFCYRCLDCENCYECQECQDCKNSSGCFGSVDLIGCHDCIGCVGLRNARYCVFNESVGEAEYREVASGLNLSHTSGRNEALQRCRNFIKAQPHKVDRLVNTEKCTGNYLRNCRNCFNSFHSIDCEDCGYLVTGQKSSDCWRGFAINGELGYRSMIAGGYGQLASYVCADSQYVIHSFACVNHSSHCFGCVGLKGTSYAILNKQYSKEEYLELLPRIIAHMQMTKEWAEFFPPALSPYPYQDTFSYDIFVRLPETVLKARGYRMSTPHESNRAGAPAPEPVPDSFEDADFDSMLKKTFRCIDSGALFRLQKKELSFYLKNRIPPPQRSWKSQIQSLLNAREPIPTV